MTFRLSEAARQDIERVWEYIAQDAPESATAFTALLMERFSLLATQPRAGRRCAGFRPDLRRIPVKNHVIFYLVEGDRIDIVRVFHGARDIEALLPEAGEGGPPA